jgi:hypothetical protein
VRSVETGDLFRGNVFAGAFSVVGGVADNLNNTEAVAIQDPGGVYEVTVVAANVLASARPDIATPWQDFALVIDNAEVPAADPVSVVAVLDRSGSMQIFGYVDITRQTSRQFIDLLSVDDSVARRELRLHGYRGVPKARLQIARLVLLRDKLKQKTGEDILASLVHVVTLGGATLKPNVLGGVEAVTSRVEQGPVSVGVGTIANVGAVLGGGSGGSAGHGNVLDPRFVQRPRHAGVLSGRFNGTKVPGSYTVQITAAGFSPVCNSSFVRHDLLSVVVLERR